MASMNRWLRGCVRGPNCGGARLLYPREGWRWLTLGSCVLQVCQLVSKKLLVSEGASAYVAGPEEGA